MNVACGGENFEKTRNVWMVEERESREFIEELFRRGLGFLDVCAVNELDGDLFVMVQSSDQL